MGPYTQKPNSVIETAFFNLNYMEAKSGRNFRKIGLLVLFGGLVIEV